MMKKYRVTYCKECQARFLQPANQERSICISCYSERMFWRFSFSLALLASGLTATVLLSL